MNPSGGTMNVALYLRRFGMVLVRILIWSQFSIRHSSFMGPISAWKSTDVNKGTVVCYFTYCFWLKRNFFSVPILISIPVFFFGSRCKKIYYVHYLLFLFMSLRFLSSLFSYLTSLHIERWAVNESFNLYRLIFLSIKMENCAPCACKHVL